MPGIVLGTGVRAEQGRTTLFTELISPVCAVGAKAAMLTSVPMSDRRLEVEEQDAIP